ncbi:hypothetical protein [Kibdelosporangium phytohabitans]|uniref:Secreted protein n=1 Tax=Kibdelosporangium phytohabitans TaxID=860235 RepID=A0A0N9I5A0_9PSEU|nr:hypothetical protein [Kibdelosporangium phytohabitans]ALG11077.1 hypothetical protein AOZ06_33095 [Kibdelosporangium phytohabitans]MBE1462318.1 hypothetical protein [Kibdelosporangium phytohabitans]
MLRPVLIGAIALTATLLGAGTAAADPVFTYDITKGSSTIKKLNSSLPLGPGGLVVDLEGATGNFTADMTLPPAKGEFKILGVFPTTATVTFQQVGKVTGTLVDGVVKAHTNVTIRLSDVKAVGLPMFVGDNCHTSKPATIDLDSAPEFNPLEGGDLIAKPYTIPEFTDCGLSTLMLNGLIPGPDNSLRLTLAIKW